MDLSSYVLLSHEQALRRRLDVVANNLANVGTVGFRREQPRFAELVERSAGEGPADAAAVSFVLDQGAVHDVTRGAFQQTGNPLDVMIDGEGYFNVSAPDGNTAYTRAGNLKLLDNGQLATAAGHALLGEGGAPIVIPPAAAGRVRIAADGTVSGPDGPLGRLVVTAFDNEAMLVPRGDGLLGGEGGSPLPAASVRIRGGGLESSNVQPVAETTRMIEVLRSYQTSQHLFDSIADLRRRVLDRLGRIGN